MAHRDRLLCVLVTLVLGCGQGPRLAQVKGTVRLDGQPLPGAEIEFQPESGVPSFGVTDAQGHYELRHLHQRAGALPGKHTVRIQMGEPDDPSHKAIRLPPEYNDESTLTREVVPGENTIDFELTGPIHSTPRTPAAVGP